MTSTTANDHVGWRGRHLKKLRNVNCLWRKIRRINLPAYWFRVDLKTGEAIRDFRTLVLTVDDKNEEEWRMKLFFDKRKRSAKRAGSNTLEGDTMVYIIIRYESDINTD